ncbi:hypothetical protein GUJ93_ZPchr0006g44431 [Zizania palustris]|uniref:Uncharacterized protein n=1 Tax=Zizania palustris TaxID=103762 RepID=A0A8J5VKZ2_ZIZPA|nr:hypothetical protein GUJ93_ZPchr0006g44431 [Zizania palustris]
MHVSHSDVSLQAKVVDAFGPDPVSFKHQVDLSLLHYNSRQEEGVVLVVAVLAVLVAVDLLLHLTVQSERAFSKVGDRQ